MSSHEQRMLLAVALGRMLVNSGKDGRLLIDDPGECVRLEMDDFNGGPFALTIDLAQGLTSISGHVEREAVESLMAILQKMFAALELPSELSTLMQMPSFSLN